MEHDASPEGQPLQQPTPATAMSRRSLLRTGLKVSPIVATLASRPVSAATCLAASAVLSAGSPGRVVAPVSSCSGLGPASYQSTWTSTSTKLTSVQPTGTFSSLSSVSTAMFTNVFGTSVTVKKPDATLLNVLQDPAGQIGGNTDQQALARNLSAAYANFLSGRTDPSIVTLDFLQKSWSLGYNSQLPVAGSTRLWGPVEINAWLTKTFTTA